MEGFVNNPVAFWITHTRELYGLPALLDHQFHTVVKRSGQTKEVGEYRRHVSSIKRMIESIYNCEKSTPSLRAGDGDADGAAAGNTSPGVTANARSPSPAQSQADDRE